MQEKPDGAKFRQVLGHYPTGVCAITSMQGDTPTAMIVGSFTSISLDPPLVGFFPDHKSTSWPRIQSAGRFCVNVLGAHHLDLCGLLASKSKDKFDNVPYRLSENGSPILDDVLAWIDCDLVSVTEAGDHFLAMGAVKQLEGEHDGHPLLFFKGGYGKFAGMDVD